MSISNSASSQAPPKSKVEWSWELEHADRRKEAKADAAFHGLHPFQIDRKVLMDIVREAFGTDVGRITFLSSGTFHKAYLITLVDGHELVARVARRLMPRMKTMSEVATMHFLREYTNLPVPQVWHYDSNPYNRLGGEYILMSKAPGIPLGQVYCSMKQGKLLSLLDNMAMLVIQLFSYRFPCIGSLYFKPTAAPVIRSSSSWSISSSSSPTPKATFPPIFPSTPKPLSSSITASCPPDLYVGPITSWPFFGSNRGELSHPKEINRGPWSSTYAYLLSCAGREISGVIRENEGKSAPHKLHLDPAEIISSRHHRIRALAGDTSDDSDEWDLEESEEEWEGPGDVMYRDYRRFQRGTFLIAHMERREAAVRAEMTRFMQFMEKLGVGKDTGNEEFGLDLHDLSLENIFVDETDHSKITCIIDWESTTTRPLWACAHPPAFLQSSPFTSDLFRNAVRKLASAPHLSSSPLSPTVPFQAMNQGLHLLTQEWLKYEESGTRLRLAHRFVEWDGWEEGLIDSIFGPEGHEHEWFNESETCGLNDRVSDIKDIEDGGNQRGKEDGKIERRNVPCGKEKGRPQQQPTEPGDICGVRSGELERKLNAWLRMNETNGRTPG